MRLPRETGGDRAGNEFVHRDVVLPHLFRKTAREHPHARFADVVGGTARGGTVPHARSHVYHPAAARFDHQRQQRARHQVGTDAVDRDILDPQVGVTLQDAVAFQAAARVVDQHVEAAELPAHDVRQRVHLVAAG